MNRVFQLEVNVKKQNRLYYNYAGYLALFTIFYNVIEGIVSVALGFHDEALTLAGFGVDSFIEVMSGIGIYVMVLRLKNNPELPKNRLEIMALKNTGIGFYILTAGLVIGAFLNSIYGHKPETTLWGIVISLISIAVMYWLYKSKVTFGKKLNSEPIISDANCTLVCIYMSVILLLSSGIYEITGFAYSDSLGALGLAWFSYKEGKEAFEKAEGKACSCGGSDCN